MKFLNQAKLFANVLFVTIATILGTGILGLPVKLAHSGLWPFIFTFTFVLAMQISVVVLVVVVIQRTALHLRRQQQAADTAGSVAHGGDTACSSEVTQAEQDTHGEELPATSELAVSTDLHTMGQLYLPRSARLWFDVAVLLHFVSVLISYALAGSLAYGRLFSMGDAWPWLLPLYVCGFGAVVIFGASAVAPIISGLTIAKCTLLLFMVGIVGGVAAAIDMSPVSDWAALGEPLLLGTVALGGVVNLLPVLAQRTPSTRHAYKLMLTAALCGVFICYVLNIVWAAFVLYIVPQTEAQAQAAGQKHAALANGHVSLEAAEAAGQISTVPVAEVIDAGFPQYAWVSVLVTAFICLSVSVSFITLSTGLVHVLRGVVDGVWRKRAIAAAEADEGAAASVGSAAEEAAEQAVAQVEEDVMEHSEAIGMSGINVSASLQDVVSAVQLSTPAALDQQSSSGSVYGAVAAPAPAPVFTRDAAEAKLRGQCLAAWACVRRSARAASSAVWQATARLVPVLQTQHGQRGALYCVMFGLVLLVALINPSGFLIVLEVFTSMAVNLEAGLFVALMWMGAEPHGALSLPELARKAWYALPCARSPGAARSSLLQQPAEGDAPAGAVEEAEEDELRPADAAAAAADAETGIPLPVSRTLGSSLAWFAVASFGYCIVYDIVTACAQAFGWRATFMCAVAVACWLWRRRVLARIWPAVDHAKLQRVHAQADVALGLSALLRTRGARDIAAPALTLFGLFVYGTVTYYVAWMWALIACHWLLLELGVAYLLYGCRRPKLAVLASALYWLVMVGVMAIPSAFTNGWGVFALCCYAIGVAWCAWLQHCTARLEDSQGSAAQQATAVPTWSNATDRMYADPTEQVAVSA